MAFGDGPYSFLRKRFLNAFKVKISSFKVRVLAFQGPDLICNPLKIAVLRGSGTVELKINAHRRTFDLTIECKD